VRSANQKHKIGGALQFLDLIDIAMIFTGLDNNQAGEAVRRLLEQFPDIQSNRLKFKFPGF
jgi:hypothetical protein